MYIPTTVLTGGGTQGPPGAPGGGGAYPSSALYMFVDYANGLDANDGLSPSTAKKTLQAAYNALVTAAEATYTAISGILPVGTMIAFPGSHDVGTGVSIFGTRPVDITGLKSGGGRPTAPNSSARIVTSSAAATSMISISETGDTLGFGCEISNMGFIVDTAVNTALVGTALGLIHSNKQDFLRVTCCTADVANASTHISTPFIHQQATGSTPDSAWARVIDNHVARVGLIRFSATGTNYNRLSIRDNTVFFDGGASNLAMVHANDDFRASVVQGNNFEGIARAVFLGGGVSDFNTFIGNSGEAFDNTQPYYDFTNGSQYNMVIGGHCTCIDNSNGTFITFDSTSHGNLVIASCDEIGFNGFKLKYVDNSTLGNSVIVPGNGPIAKIKSGAGLTTAADGDFVGGTIDGQWEIVRNSSDGSAKLAIRVNGAYKYVTLT